MLPLLAILPGIFICSYRLCGAETGSFAALNRLHVQVQSA